MAFVERGQFYRKIESSYKFTKNAKILESGLADLSSLGLSALGIAHYLILFSLSEFCSSSEYVH